MNSRRKYVCIGITLGGFAGLSLGYTAGPSLSYAYNYVYSLEDNLWNKPQYANCSQTMMGVDCCINDWRLGSQSDPQCEKTLDALFDSVTQSAFSHSCMTKENIFSTLAGYSFGGMIVGGLVTHHYLKSSAYNPRLFGSSRRENTRSEKDLENPHEPLLPVARATYGSIGR
jgi:hypothetical protein